MNKKERQYIAFYVYPEMKESWVKEAKKRKLPLATFIKECVNTAIHKPEQNLLGPGTFIKKSDFEESMKSMFDEIIRLRKEISENTPKSPTKIHDIERISLTLSKMPMNSEDLSKILSIDRFQLEQILHELYESKKVEYDFKKNLWSVV